MPRGETLVALTAADRVYVINDAGERTASITLPAGSLPTNICIGGGPADEAVHHRGARRVAAAYPSRRTR